MTSGRKTMRTRAGASALVIALMNMGTIGLVQAQPEPAVITQSPLDEIVLQDLDGRDVRLIDLTGRPLILVFGEVDHSRTRQACDELASLLATPEMRGTNALSVLITTRAGTAVGEGEQEFVMPERRLLDPDRDAFGAFHVIVMPTIVVLDMEGIRVHSMPGFVPRMSETVLASVRFARGEITSQEFDEVLNPYAQVEQTDDQKHAARLVLMAEELQTHGMFDLALESFNQAITLDPEQVGALIGLGRVWSEKKEPDKAIVQYLAALKIQPDSIDAQLGIAFIQLELGAEEADKAYRTAGKLAESSPNDPRVHFLLGTIHDRHGRCELACESFKRCSELLLGSDSLGGG